MDDPHGGKWRDWNLQCDRPGQRRSAIGGMLDGIKAALKSNAKFIWVDEKFSTNQKVQAWSDMPVWAGAEDGITRTNIKSCAFQRANLSLA